ncbi:MAG TPA: hypothetical protein V6D29_03995 [Leptolyngbyaceae cyanobacterium]
MALAVVLTIFTAQFAKDLFKREQKFVYIELPYQSEQAQEILASQDFQLIVDKEPAPVVAATPKQLTPAVEPPKPTQESPAPAPQQPEVSAPAPQPEMSQPTPQTRVNPTLIEIPGIGGMPPQAIDISDLFSQFQGPALDPQTTQAMRQRFKKIPKPQANGAKPTTVQAPILKPRPQRPIDTETATAVRPTLNSGKFF